MEKKKPSSPSPLKAKYDALSSTNKGLLKFLCVMIVLVSLGVIYHTNTDQSMESTQRFLEQRRGTPESQFLQENPEEQSAKKRAEKNIFLQN